MTTLLDRYEVAYRLRVTATELRQLKKNITFPKPVDDDMDGFDLWDTEEELLGEVLAGASEP